MRVIAVINQKGGTGKTTTTINLGKALTERQKRVLLIDFDAQGNLSYSLGVNDFEYSMADVLLGDQNLEDVLVEREGMKIAPSDRQLADAELSLASVNNNESRLLKAISTLSGFDFILIDCPPSLSILTLNALIACKKVIIPMQMEVLSLQGLDQIIQTIDKVNSTFHQNITVEGILPVMVDKRRKLSQEIHDFINENYNLHIFKNQIRNNVTASEAPSFGKSVINYKSTCNSAIDYMRFSDEILSLNSN
jgi:chromosome partitioning protein